MAGNFINGIDVDKLNETKNILKDNPEVGKFKFMVENKWIEANYSQITIQEFYQAGIKDGSRTKAWVFELDEPPAFLGENRGPNPVEYILLALSGCLTSALVVAASAKGVKLKSVESHLEGDLDARGFLKIDPDIRPGYQQIRVHFKIDTDAPDKEIVELVELAQQTSPVFDIVTNMVTVSVAYEKK
ncbi:MAG: hypothetical protein A2Y25_11555 [Candidatus Melainabacteria bacterium GWF2_37_15]|nr:MAG: hypothetical protein A2Y25_11555 [Candidatus Melainabacteria bacterium GWF2_37_15]